MNELLEKLRGGLIVSCQALENEPLHGSHIMRKMALAVKEGGAVAIRSNGVKDIIAIKDETQLPIIGLIKRDYDNCPVYITPTVTEINELLSSGCEIIALDATDRCHVDGVTLKEKLDLIHKNNRLAMADVSTLEEGMRAEALGFDLISTTLSGYTPYSPQQVEPDFSLVEKMVQTVKIPVIAEGRISSDADVKKMMQYNPFAIVIGGAITRPQNITKRFVSAMSK